MRLQNEAQMNVGRPTTFTDEEIQKAIDGSDQNYYANTDWIDELYKSSAAQQNHNISINGGSANTVYYLSYGFLSQDGLITGDAFGSRRHNLRARISTTLLDKLQLEGILGYVDRRNTESSWATDENGGVIYSAHTISPLIPVKFTNGGWGYGGGSTNPIAIATDGGDNVFTSQEVTGNFKATVEVVKDLKLSAQYGLVMSNSKRDIFTRKVVYYYPEDGKYWYTSTQFNSLDARDYINRYQSFIATADYDKSFGGHHVHFLAGYSQEWTRNDYFQASRQDFVSDELEALNGGTQNQRNSGEAYHWALRSGFGRLNYDFSNKYLFEANLRYDGTSRFQKDDRFGVFPSFSVGWRVSEESFMKFSNAFMPDFKLRASWGKLGNQYITGQSSNFAYYPYISVIGSVSTMPIGNAITPAYAQTVLANQNIGWESVTMTNIAADASFLNSRLNLTVDWFTKTTDDILLKVLLPDVLGLSEPEQNAGAVENKGWEFNLGWQDRIGEVRYKVTALYSNIKNKVTNLGGVPPSYGEQIRQVGYPIDAFYGLVADRIAQPEDFDYDPATGKYTPKFPVFEEDLNIVRPGDIIYKNLSDEEGGEGKITLDRDRKVIGNPFPQHTFSLRGDVAWKGIDFSFFLQGVTKADGYLKGSARHAFITESAYPKKEHLDRWTPDNPDASYPRLTYQQSHNQRLSTFWLENAAYVRLKNVQIGYTLPSSLIRKARFESVRIYASADNLLTATDFFESYDPETPVSSGGYYPQVKTFIVGVNMTLK
jgi:TonB-linked SusC/RagA family outer membrane protein